MVYTYSVCFHILIAFVFMECKIRHGFICPEKQNTCNFKGEMVAFCVRRKEPEEDYCETKLLKNVFEVDNKCKPDDCRFNIMDYCNPTNPCKNGGKCINYPGSYSCDCKSGFYGRNCAKKGGKGKNSYFVLIYNPIIGWTPSKSGEHQILRSKAVIFLRIGEDNPSMVVLTTSCSVGWILRKEIMKTAEIPSEVCRSKFKEDERVKDKFCKYLPEENMLYTTMYYDIPFDNINEPPGSVVQSYNREVQSNIAAFKVSHLKVDLLRGNKREYTVKFDLVSILQREKASECQTPVTLLVENIRCEEPLRRYRKDTISFKSVFETTPKFGSVVCHYIHPTYHWETFNYRNLFDKPFPSKDKSLPSKTCDQTGTNNQHCYESFEIKPYELTDGSTYQIKLTVSATLQKTTTLGVDNADPISIQTFGTYYILIKTSPLIAIIDGGESRTVSVRDSKVVIDGSRSYDPNEPNDPEHQSHLRWSWSCKGISPCCKALNGKICKVIGQLQDENEYEFVLKLTSPRKFYRSRLSASVTQKITVSNRPQIHLAIRCLKNCGRNGFKTNPREIVYLEVIVLDKSMKSEDISFIWKYSCDNADMKSVDDIREANVYSHILIVKRDKLTPGSECKFTVNTDPKGVEGRSSIVIQVNVPLTMGVCEISSKCEPNKCFKGVAKFTIYCSNFTNHIESVQLVYSFYQNDGQVSPGTLLGFSMSGELNDVILTEESVTVRVSDQYGMYIDYRTKVPKVLKDWDPNNDVMNKFLDNLEASVLSRDSSSSAMTAGAIVDVIWDMSKKSSPKDKSKQSFRLTEILEKVLDGLTKDYVNDMSDVKLYSSTMKKIVSKAIKDGCIQVTSKIAESLGKLMVQLSGQLLLDVNTNIKKCPHISDEEIKEVALCVVESADTIVSSKNEKALDVRTGTIAVFARHNQYKRGTASLIRGLKFSGMAILDTLLPHQNEVVIKAENTIMWNKVESPAILANTAGIPQNSSTKIKMSRAFGNKLQRISETIALQVITFRNNPYWWDVQDKDVASEIISVATWRQPEGGLKMFNNKLITDISEELDVYLKLQTTREETVTGSVTVPAVSASEDEKDRSVAVHTLEAPPENSNGKLFVEFEDLGRTELRVLLTENLYPDYEMMMSESKIVNAQSPLISLPFYNVPHDTLQFIGILPDKQNKPGQTIKYKFKLYSIQCKTRQQTVWTSPACTVGDETTKDVVHCKCSHMSFFGSSIFVAPNTVHPVDDIKLLLTVKDNPIVFMVVLIILITYLILIFWAVRKDRKNMLMRKVLVLEDNFPGEKYCYLIVVYTAFNYGAGTDSNVGVSLIGADNKYSRSHILRSRERRVFKRNSDDWFLITTPSSLGELIAIHLWHDNSGPHPHWYCERVVVYDICRGVDYTFVIERWLGVWPREFPEALVQPSDPDELYDWTRVIMHNVLYNLREKHLWLSIYMSHPRATVTKSQRVTIAFCIILINLLIGVMFYGVAQGGVQYDDPAYTLKLRVFIVAVQSAVIATLATAPVVICFRRSQQITLQETKQRKRAVILHIESDVEGLAELARANLGKRCYGCFKNFMSKMVTGKPLIPVLAGKQSPESVIVRKRWAQFGWVMSQIVIWGSGYLIILHGLKLGKVISKLWITSAGLSISTGAFLNSPIKIIIVSMVLSMFGEIYDITSYEFDSEKTVKQELFGDEEHLANVIEMRKAGIYKPIQRKKIAEYRKVALHRLKWLDRAEFYASVFLFVILMYISGDFWQVKSFQVTSHIKHTLKTSYGSSAVPLKDVTNIKKLTDYLISKLFRVLYTGSWYYKKKKLTSPEESWPEMGWFSDTVNRMVGIPRMRQLRVKAEKCPWAELFNASKVVCGFHLSKSTEDTKNYGLHWGNITKDINKPLLVPWTYQSVEGSEHLYGATGVVYHTGGYTVDLPDTQERCNTLISDLMDLRWWDLRMRAFIVELTLYNPNTDTYSLVSIVFEHLESGVFAAKVDVTTAHLQFHVISRIIYFGVLIFFNINLFLFINRQGIVFTLSHFWGCYDIVFLFIANSALIFNFVTLIRTSTAVEFFHEDGVSGFFYFTDIVWYEKTSLMLWGMALILIPIRLLKFKPFVETCKKTCYTLYKAGRFLLTVSLQMIGLTYIQLYVINYVKFPMNHPLSLYTRFYKPTVREPQSTPSGYYQGMFSVALAYRLGSYAFFLQMILITFYKVSLMNKF